MTGDAVSLRPVELGLTPEQALAAWAAEEPLAVLWSGGKSEHARWTVLARPRSVERARPGSVEEAKSFLDQCLGSRPGAMAIPGATAPSGAMATSSSLWGGVGAADIPPFRGGHLLALSYDLGRVLEPAVGKSRHAGAPLICVWECRDAFIFDNLLGRWWAVGEPPDLAGGMEPRPFTVSVPKTDLTQQQYEAAVERILEYIRAGDVYQVNLAHRLTANFSGCTRAFFAALMRTAGPWYGAYLETGDAAIASASPELFLSYDPTIRRLTTRPMKGTRPAAMVQDLEHSSKDAAELNMITDLMRNDIGRVSELGSVSVERRRTFEHHNQLVQTTSTVTGTLREGHSVVDALLSAFPGGSVTGCPKIRAMQIIDELEATPRGFYCGTIGYISTSGHAAFNIAIRTPVIQAGTLTYHAGAGIVIDSDPAAEWQETLDKAGILTRLGSHP